MTKTIALLFVPCLLSAQDANPLSSSAKMMYQQVKGFVTKAAANMSEENYAFKPTPDVRSFGALVGHIADAQYLFCSAVKGEKREPVGVEKTKTSKADLQAALKEAFGYCDAVYDAMTDAEAAKLVSLFGRQRAALGVLDFNTAHMYEHYGNIVTYMRLKGMVPPSSEGRR